MKILTTYRYLKLVEYTSLPLTTALLLYIVSGYGMVSNIPAIIGFNYPLSSRIHTLPLLRYLTTILVAIHSYAGLAILINRNLWKKPTIKNLLSYINLIYVTFLILIITMSEIYVILTS
ncbi:MAG: hypothetical protein QXZ10_02845 [Sulfolobales archaeon]